MNDILPVILFDPFFFHNPCYIVNNEIWTLQNSKSQYIHQVMASNVSYKLILAKIILQLWYKKFMNDNLPIILFHSFFFHNSFYIINNEIWILQTWKNQYTFTKFWHLMVVWNWCWLKSYCNFATKKSIMISFLSFFFILSFFIIHIKS